MYSKSDTKRKGALYSSRAGNSPNEPVIHKERTTMIEQLKNVVVDNIRLEDAMTLMDFARSLEAQYETYGADKPKWLIENREALDFQIKRMVRDELQRKIQKAKSELASLATAEEKRAALKEQLAALEGKLV